MRDIHRLVRRPVLATSNDRTGAATSVTVLDPAARFSLRIGSAEGANRQTVAGFRIDSPINTCSVEGERLSARLGPDEWLLLAPGPDGISLGQNIAAELKGAFFSLVDISHRNVGFWIDGAHAAEIVNGGCPLDLDDAIFPTGSATRTLLGKAEIVLIRPGNKKAYQVECWRSFAPYVHGLLKDVAREFDADDPVKP
jgi:sarcosine oxidase subunit gamma